MFNYLDDKAFVEFVLKRGSIPFHVRGNLECESNFRFSPFVDIEVSRPTVRLKVIGESAELQAPLEVFVGELNGEVVFPGEIRLPEKTTEGIAKALHALELWADFLCLATGNPKIRIEVQHPIIPVINVERKLDPELLNRWAQLSEFYFARLKKSERKKLASALWWYRKGCAALHYSVFDSYTAYWNCLEILCEVSGSRTKQGPEVDEAILNYLNSKKRIRRGHILHCYNKFVLYSIPRQMEDSLKKTVGEEQARQIVYQCFEVKPENERLYQIRNDINHGNIRENSVQDYERVYLRGQLLWHIVHTLLHQNLGRQISIGMDINSVAEELSNPPWHSEEG